jgi:hypothetical protein
VIEYLDMRLQGLVLLRHKRMPLAYDSGRFQVSRRLGHKSGESLFEAGLESDHEPEALSEPSLPASLHGRSSNTSRPSTTASGITARSRCSHR